MINFLSQWAIPDPLKAFPYSLWTELITQLEAVPALFVPAFQAQERCIITRDTSLSISSLLYSAQDTCLRARRTWKFRWQPGVLLSPSSKGPCGHCAEGKVQLLPLQQWPRASSNWTCCHRAETRTTRNLAPTCVLAVPLSPRFYHPPSLPKKRDFENLDLFTALTYNLIPCGVV